MRGAESRAGDDVSVYGFIERRHYERDGRSHELSKIVVERIERLRVAYGREPGRSAAVRRFKVEAGSLKEVIQ